MDDKSVVVVSSCRNVFSRELRLPTYRKHALDSRLRHCL